ncbi:dNTP triphosphohydrolase [Sulfitobacter sp. NFXS29]|uniref:dGTP triphosphohydrolase n=1 Tax=Sulfitobacter sp. NFXS29 TaxID=2818438 RepID=UPI0032DE5559
MTGDSMKWDELLSDNRFSNVFTRPKPTERPSSEHLSFLKGQFRTAQERDHDRVLFATPFRRLGDKTQVFPLESNESIRTRLTHSIEVANLARSIGLEVAETFKDRLPEFADRSVPAILACVGLAHDIGNPPFGHQGEYAIRAWFERNKKALFEVPERDCVAGKVAAGMRKDLASLTEQHKNDFLEFEGNAQTLRVLTKLQVMADDLGLNLTLGTLASVMKYVAPSDGLDENKQALKKVGYFASEKSLVEKIRAEVGLSGTARHPIALIMEACDDIAYSVMDAEDAIKKGFVSLNDLLATLSHQPRDKDGKIPEQDPVIGYICEVTDFELHELRGQEKLHPSELQDVATQKFRVHAIHLMVSAVVEAFGENYKAIMDGSFSGELIKVSKAGKLCSALKKFDRENAFSHKEVLEIELNGYNTLNRLMDYLWIGISDRKSYDDPSSKRRSPFSAYVYSRISKNYKRIFENAITEYHGDQSLPIRYKEMQLLTDMVSGMTDQFCIDLYNDLDCHYREMKPVS